LDFYPDFYVFYTEIHGEGRAQRFTEELVFLPCFLDFLHRDTRRRKGTEIHRGIGFSNLLFRVFTQRYTEKEGTEIHREIGFLICFLGFLHRDTRRRKAQRFTEEKVFLS